MFRARLVQRNTAQQRRAGQRAREGGGGRHGWRPAIGTLAGVCRTGGRLAADWRRRLAKRLRWRGAVVVQCSGAVVGEAGLALTLTQ